MAREQQAEKKRSCLCVLGVAIYSYYAALTAFRYHLALKCIVADWALSNSRLLMPHQQAWQHIIDMPIQMIVFLSAAYAADINAHTVMKPWLDKAHSTMTAIWFYYSLKKDLFSYILIICGASSAFFK